ncbi:hypothetical protein ABZ307_38030 [Streptomyces griseorubiginosus]|uniref:hypothetical protein n=1 Tax=Streptomyces griseorubiginosus TaxID=67304 RepID=UPI0033B2A6CB
MSQNLTGPNLHSLVHEWASKWGEDNQREILWVTTTRNEAMQLIHDNVTSTNEAAYLVTLRGDFSMLVDTEKSVHGVWAALLVDPVHMEVRTYTVRPTGFIPDIDLSRLGEVSSI